MSDGEGNFTFSPSVFTPYLKAPEPMAQAESVLIRELATQGAPQMLLLKYKAVDPGTIMSRLESAFKSGEGTLEVRGYNNTPNCELLEPPAIGDGVYSARSGAGTAVVEGMGFHVPLVFLQVEE